MFDLQWHDDAAEETQEYYFTSDSPLRERISAAIREIEQTLRQHPEEVGESRARGYRVAFFDCLSVYYVVDMARQQVLVRHVWMPKRTR